MDHYSYTQLATYLQCPLKYKYHYLEGWQERETSRASFSAKPAFDASLGNFQTITLTGNVTSWSISNPPAANLSQNLTIQWCQDGSGGRIVSGTPTNVKGFTSPGTTASTCSQQTFLYNGTSWYAIAAGTTNL